MDTMKLKRNTILVTGGGTGIGLSLAEAFIKEGNTVIICGRRIDRLEKARKNIPGLHIRQCDLLKKDEREELAGWALKEFPDINVIVNNAGIQRIIDLKAGIDDITGGDDEIEVNLKALIHMSAYFIPHFIKKKHAAIINVSSGLGFVPMAMAPIYCATKAAVHSYSVSLRQQLKGTSVEVIEIIPPMVDTELGKGSRDERGITFRGLSTDEFTAEVMAGLEENEVEIAVGMAKGLRNASGKDFDEAFSRMNG